MFADRQQKAQARGLLSRSGPALAVIGIHVVIIYVISASMGMVPIPTFKAPMDAVFIEETKQQPEPAPLIEPEIEVPQQNLMPEMPLDVPVVPPIETDVVAPAEPASITAAESAAPSQVQDLQTKQRVEPTYPAAARRDGEEGTVRLRVLVDQRGRPADVQVARSSGFQRLDDAAINAVRRWRFQAATNGTTAVSAWTQVAITFKLTSK
jgi:protein TonB